MSARSTDPGRREFCRRTAAVGGGLVLAMTLPAFGGRSRSGTSATVSQLNAWLKIGADDSITVLVDRSEMGQGVYTTLPTLLAEELEIDLGRIVIAAAPVGEAYVNPLNGGQVTGTSNSLQDAWEKLRLAGARARVMLIAAAANKWHVDPADCRVKNGVVVRSARPERELRGTRGGGCAIAGSERRQAQAESGLSLDRQIAPAARYAGKSRRKRAVRSST